MLFQILLNSQTVTSGLAVGTVTVLQASCLWSDHSVLQWNLNTVDTLGTKLDNLLIIEASLIQENDDICVHIKVELSVLISEGYV